MIITFSLQALAALVIFLIGAALGVHPTVAEIVLVGTTWVVLDLIRFVREEGR